MPPLEGPRFLHPSNYVHTYPSRFRQQVEAPEGTGVGFGC
jgi:hypothetical protein